MVRDPGLVIEMAQVGRYLSANMRSSSCSILLLGEAITKEAKDSEHKARVVDCVLDDLDASPPRLYILGQVSGSPSRLQREFPNPKLASHARFKPSLLVADSYVGATSGPKLGSPALLAGLLSSGTPVSLTSRSRGVTPSSVAPECLGESKSRKGN